MGWPATMRVVVAPEGGEVSVANAPRRPEARHHRQQLEVRRLRAAELFAAGSASPRSPLWVGPSPRWRQGGRVTSDRALGGPSFPSTALLHLVSLRHREAVTRSGVRSPRQA